MATSRRSADEVREFDAPPSLPQNLQKVVTDLIELHLQGKQAHPILVGINFRDLHLQLDEIVATAREASDTVMASTTLPAIPLAEHSTTDTVELITTRINASNGDRDEEAIPR
jgi:starvation-inducible DNA-binding protein